MDRWPSRRRRCGAVLPTVAHATTSRSSEGAGMLSRVAEALFWIGRYVERAEDTARLLDVHFHEVLEDPSVDEADACSVLLTVMGVPEETARQHQNSQALLELFGYDAATATSIVGALVAA